MVPSQDYRKRYMCKVIRTPLAVLKQAKKLIRTVLKLTKLIRTSLAVLKLTKIKTLH